ncbi:hypothetical protein CEXT_378341 [Caerostris extrusa]|uniref:Secreted protein n=1 Tax=Caerostris extrusa TaxID=172846 RepID=A0AAV4Q1G4_CAEEX|nr:hypothetical protein CEXT_378341 [Caerostris extrusa]
MIYRHWNGLSQRRIVHLWTLIGLFVFLANQTVDNDLFPFFPGRVGELGRFQLRGPSVPSTSQRKIYGDFRRLHRPPTRCNVGFVGHRYLLGKLVVALIVDQCRSESFLRYHSAIMICFDTRAQERCDPSEKNSYF